MGVGRVLCVGLPFGLTIASLICLLIVMLAGITDKNLDMFQVKTQNTAIGRADAESGLRMTKTPDGLGARRS